MDSQTLPLDTSDSFQIIPSKNYEFKDASPFYYLPQRIAAEKFGLPKATFRYIIWVIELRKSKRWREASMGREWPFRKISKLDKRIYLILEKIIDINVVDDALLTTLGLLLMQRQKIAPSVFIRTN